ncbi:MAG: hypothetical protein HN561_14595 [Candidatus Scalindua sp.]|nr:hypothetical protein [Candidatus Scalindua sp.]MBT7592283.1 hypothetical protein [Candidatus Scalindua sp.]
MFVHLTHRKLIGIVMLMVFIFTPSTFAETAKESTNPTAAFLKHIILEEATGLEYNADITSLYGMVVVKKECT